MSPEPGKDARIGANRMQQAVGSGLAIGLFFALTQAWPNPQATLKPYVAGLIAAGLVLWAVTLATQINSQFRPDLQRSRRIRQTLFYLAHEVLNLIVATLVAFAAWNVPAWVRSSGIGAILNNGGLRDVSSVLILAGMGVFLVVFVMAIRSGERIEFQTQWGGLGGGGGGWRISTPAVSIIVFLVLALGWSVSQIQMRMTPADATAGGSPPVPAAPAAAEKKTPETSPAASANQAQGPGKTNSAATKADQANPAPGDSPKKE